MNESVKKENGAIDALKWLIVLTLVSVGVVGNYYFEAESVLYRVIALLILAFVAGWVAIQTIKGQAFSKLVSEARIEIRKVVWPTRQELTQTTMIVVLFVLFVALVLWGVDSLIGWIVSSIIA